MSPHHARQNAHSLFSVSFYTLSLLSLCALVSACHVSPNAQANPTSHADPHQAAPLLPRGQEGSVAIFAGGCFWCVEAALEPLKGVKEVISGYTGGPEVQPTYAEVSAAQTGHLEAVWVRFDPQVISYEALLDAFWRSINPTQADGQFADRGPQYRTAIFYLSPEQQSLAQSSLKALEKSGVFKAPIVTALRPAETFWPAESYHQDYYKTNPQHYARYKEGSGRGPFLRRVWGAHKAPSK